MLSQTYPNIWICLKYTIQPPTLTVKQGNMTAPLSFYRRAPQQRVALDDFEELGHRRVKLLSQVSARWSAQQSTVDPQTQKALEVGDDTNADQLSHYALRLAFCR